MTKGVLLVNLGTPESAETADVRKYLGEFLMDRHVIDLPTPLRWLLVRGAILPLRPRRSASAYARIWDAAGPDTGSPLMHHSLTLHERLSSALEIPCALAMRYGQPDISSAVAQLIDGGVSNIVLLALYPQHADSTRSTTIEAVTAAIRGRTELTVLPPFYDRGDYIRIQADVIRRALPQRWDHLLLSYHGLPERHLIQADPTKKHCLQQNDCCQVPSEAHATCYRHQVYRTSRLLAESLEIEQSRYTVSFQSRLGKLPWLEPYTDQTLVDLPKRGVKHLVVTCPAFVADNLETLEEIGMTGRSSFLSAGGESFTLAPCLNDDQEWVRTLVRWCDDG